MTREEYHSLRRCFAPSNIRLVIIAESPPASGLYFYDPSGRPTEPLFAALMQQLRCAPSTKENGLRRFQQRGWILVDATYEPVNDGKMRRNYVINRDFPLLVNDLRELTVNPQTPIILIKANVCRILDSKLRSRGFSVINRGRTIYFPSNGWQKIFQKQFSEVLQNS